MTDTMSAAAAAPPPFSVYTLNSRDVELAVEGYEASEQKDSEAAAARGGRVGCDSKTFYGALQLASPDHPRVSDEASLRSAFQALDAQRVLFPGDEFQSLNFAVANADRKNDRRFLCNLCGVVVRGDWRGHNKEHIRM